MNASHRRNSPARVAAFRFWEKWGAGMLAPWGCQTLEVWVSWVAGAMQDRIGARDQRCWEHLPTCLVSFCAAPVVGWIMVPKFAHILIPTTYVYVTLLGKVDFSGVIRLWILRWGDFLNYVWMPNVCGVQIMRNTGLDEAQMESRSLGEISVTSDMQMTPHYGRKWRRTQEPLDESERGDWKCWLKAQHSEN